MFVLYEKNMSFYKFVSSLYIYSLNSGKTGCNCMKIGVSQNGFGGLSKSLVTGGGHLITKSGSYCKHSISYHFHK